MSISLFKLYERFFWVGLYTIGGAYAMLPVADKILVRESNIVDENELYDNYALAQTMPGVIAANTANLIGFSKRGYLGALFALLGVITPSIIIMMVIAHFMSGFQDLIVVQKALWGIRILVVALLLNSIIKFLKSSVRNFKFAVVALVSFLLVYYSVLKPIYLMIIAAVIGFLLSNIFMGSNIKKGVGNDTDN